MAELQVVQHGRSTGGLDNPDCDTTGGEPQSPRAAAGPATRPPRGNGVVVYDREIPGAEGRRCARKGTVVRGPADRASKSSVGG
jgi:hypothetical protein